MQDNPLHDKVALITGGARRIGAQIAHSLHRAGMRLILHYHSSDDDAHRLQAALQEQRPDTVILAKGDLRDVHKINHLAQQAAGAFGRIDVLVNNASTFYATALGSTTDTQWEDLLGTNLKAPYFLCQAAAPQLRKHHGCIVNIVDIYGEVPLSGYPVYSAAKAGLIMITRALARELAPEVRVNAVAPGAILWPDDDGDEIARQRIVSRTPLKRMGSPEDVATAVLYLVRDANFTTGQVLRVDGGRLMSP